MTRVSRDQYQGSAYAPAKAQHRRDVLERAERRAWDRIFRWLERYSPWDWRAGVSAFWICTSLTAEQALATETAPVIPAEAAAYGFPHATRQPERRTVAA